MGFHIRSFHLRIKFYTCRGGYDAPHRIFRLCFRVCKPIGVRTVRDNLQRRAECEIRRELDQIIAKDPNATAAAKRALEDLDKPPTSPEGARARNRAEQNSRRIVNGIPIREIPSAGALLKGLPEGNDPKSAN